MICTHCEDSGYVWEVIDACEKCEKGKAIQHEQNKKNLKWHKREAKRLNKTIREYQRSIVLP